MEIGSIHYDAQKSSQGLNDTTSLSGGCVLGGVVYLPSNAKMA